MGFIGRAREKELADRSLDASEPSASIFLGKRGIGKSAFLRDIGRRHPDSTLLAVNRSERIWPYSGLSAFAHALGGQRATAIDRVTTASSEWTDFRVADETSRVLHATSGTHQILLIDDLDEMDAASSLALAYVFGRLPGTGLRVIASATRIDGRHPFWSLPQIRLAPLTHAESVEVASATLGPSTARGVLHIVAASTGGNPSAIRRVRLAPHEQAGESPVPLPLRLRAEVPPRPEEELSIDRRNPTVHRLLTLLALAPETAREAVTGLLPDGASLVDDLLDAGILTSHAGMIRVADPLDRISLYRSLDARERLSGHEELQRAHSGSSPRLEQWHRSFAETSDESAGLLESAAHYVVGGDAAAAVEFAEQALTRAGTVAGRDRALVRLGEALCDEGYFALAELYLARATSLDDEDVSVLARIVSLRVADALDGVVDDAIVDSYVASSAEIDAVGCVRLLEEVARIRIRRREYPRARARLVAARSLASGSLSLEHRLMNAIIDPHTSNASTGLRFADLATDPTEPDAVVDLTAPELALLIRFLTMTERYGLARRRAAFHLERMDRLAPFWEEFIRRLLVENEFRAGDTPGAKDALTAWERSALSELKTDAARHLSAIGARAVQPDVDVEHLEEMIAEGRALCLREHNAALPPFFDVLDARCALASGRLDDAVELFRDAMSDVHAPEDPAVMRCASDLVEALCTLGRTDEALEALGRFEADVERYPSRWAERAVARARAVCARSTDGTRSEGAAVSKGGTVVPLSCLTDDEREVAQLVHRGLRNREIAAQLFVSTRTVELRLTRIYRKLEVRSRSHLASVLVNE